MRDDGLLDCLLLILLLLLPLLLNAMPGFTLPCQLAPTGVVWGKAARMMETRSFIVLGSLPSFLPSSVRSFWCHCHSEVCFLDGADGKLREI